MKKMNDNLVPPLSFLLSLLFSLVFNLRHLPLRTALKFPILLHWKTKVRIKNSTIVFQTDKIYRGMVVFGIGLGEERWAAGNILTLIDGRLEIAGDVKIRFGATLSILGGTARLGADFSANNNLLLVCHERVEFGAGVLIGAGVSVRDTDGTHRLNAVSHPVAAVKVGAHVWIGSSTDLLKGVAIKDGVVVGYRSLVTSAINQAHNENSLIAGSPAKMLKERVTWEI